MRLWAPIWFGLGTPGYFNYDVTAAEAFLYGVLLTLALTLALAPALILSW